MCSNNCWEKKDTVYAIAFAAPHLGELFSVTPEAPWVQTGRGWVFFTQFGILNFESFLIFAVHLYGSTLAHPESAIKRKQGKGKQIISKMYRPGYLEITSLLLLNDKNSPHENRKHQFKDITT